MNPSDKYEQIKDIKRLNPVELEATVLRHEKEIQELKRLVTPMMEFKRGGWVGLTGDEIEDLPKGGTMWKIIRAAEAILKEKNCG